MDPFYDFVIQPGKRCANLIDAIDHILNFNEKV